MDLTLKKLLLASVVALPIYWIIPRRLQNYLLLAISLLVYTTFSWEFTLLLSVLIVVNFVLAQELEARKRPVLLWLGIAFNVLGLAFLRAAGFLISIAPHSILTGVVRLLTSIEVPAQVDTLEILFPLGFSFLVVQAISYLVDIHRRQLPASTDLVDFALYMAFFPKLISGPIERASAFLPKLAEQRIVDNQSLSRGFALVLIGMVRKSVVADNLLALIPNEAFQTPLMFSAPQLAVWLVTYSFVLYNDFAGYTSIVRGISILFGIELSPNFKQPYFARSFTEFWNQWHITLSHWLRDYIYYPLSRRFLRRNPSRKNLPNLIIPPIATMLVSGLWHGTSLNMLVWGGMHGIYQVAERIPTLWRPAVPPQKQPAWKQALRTALVVALAMVAWVPFRMKMPVAITYWQGLLQWSRVVEVEPVPFARFAIFMLPGLLLDWIQYRPQNELVYLRWPRLAQAALMAVALLFIIVTRRTEAPPPLIYQAF
jgi:D-alanyl-lipoteichoic acid acyltransferase DltB (MBOAT superfamily)